MPKRDFIKTIEGLGADIGRLDRAMLTFASTVCAAAADGSVMLSDADHILEVFTTARRKGRGEPGPYEPPSGTQVSKVRVFLRMGEMLGSDSVKMIERLPHLIETPTRYGGTYNIAIEVGRAALHKERVLTDREIRKMYP